MKLNISSLDRALTTVGRATERSMREPSNEEVRDAVILRFEYCYELSWKMLKRQAEQELPNPADADRMSFAELIREGAERGLVAPSDGYPAATNAISRRIPTTKRRPSPYMQQRSNSSQTARTACGAFGPKYA